MAGDGPSEQIMKQLRALTATDPLINWATFGGQRIKELAVTVQMNATTVKLRMHDGSSCKMLTMTRTMEVRGRLHGIDASCNGCDRSWMKN